MTAQGESLNLEDIDKRLETVKKEFASSKQTYVREIESIKAEARSEAHLRFYKQYDEWDWTVRQKYMDLVKSMAYTYPWPDGTRGYSFELVNYTPWFPEQINDSNFVATPDHIKPYDRRSLIRTSVTEFVKPENITKCKLSQKIVDAFKLLKYLDPQGYAEKRGFGIDRKEVSWKNGGPQQEENPDDEDYDFEYEKSVSESKSGFDHQGYKFHLSDEK